MGYVDSCLLIYLNCYFYSQLSIVTVTVVKGADYISVELQLLMDPLFEPPDQGF
jgi:hypothetical protein